MLSEPPVTDGPRGAKRSLARLHGRQRVDWALAHAASYGRFGDGDLASILAANPPGMRRTADEIHSLQTGTQASNGFGGSGHSR